MAWTAGRERAFLAGLSESCNVTLACERARVSRSRAYARRGEDAAFAAAWEAAVAEGEARLGSAGVALGARPSTLRPSSGQAMLGTNGGVEVKGPGDMVVRGGRGRRVQVARARPSQFTARRQAAFLEHLAETANVQAALRACGAAGVDVYRHRARWPGFARAWDEAIEQGYARIEAMLIERATNVMPAEASVVTGPSTLRDGSGQASSGQADLGGTPAEFDPVLALNILKAHWARVDRAGKGARRGGFAPREPSIEEVRASILSKLDAIDRHEARKQAAAGIS